MPLAWHALPILYRSHRYDVRFAYASGPTSLAGPCTSSRKRMGLHGNMMASDTIRRVDRRLLAPTLAVMTTDDSAQTTRLLARRDPVLGAIIRQHGACGLARDQRTDPFAALIEAIAWQQLSTKAAARIFERFLALFPDSSVLTPADLVALPDSHIL